MIIATNLEHLNDLPKPSVKGGWNRTVYLSDDFACDGSILVIGKLKATDRANVERYTKLDPAKYGRDRNEAEIAGIIAHELRNLDDLEKVEFLGCAGTLALLRHAHYKLDPNQINFTVPAARLSYALRLTDADNLKRRPGQGYNSLLLYRGDVLVGIIGVVMG